MSETELEKHYRETLEYIGDYAAQRNHIIYCDHIAQVIINKLKEGHNLTSQSSERLYNCPECGDRILQQGTEHCYNEYCPGRR